MTELFTNLSLIILIAFLVSFMIRLLKQPLLIGYIITGIIAGPYFFNLIEADQTIGTFSKLGVALLLFTVGLHLNPKVIKEVGKTALITGVGQVIFTSVIGFLIAKGLGFATLTSVYISVAFTFSSTIIILKLLSDKGDLNSVYGKVSVGLLIFQDLIAVFLLMIISSSSNNIVTPFLITFTVIKGIFILGALFLISLYLLPHITNFVAKSQEFLFLFSIAWCFALASLFQYFGFSLEIGALLAGISLSTSVYGAEISSKLKPLRDFFIVMFFVVIGSQMIIGEVGANVVPVIIFSLFILIGHPVIMMMLMGALGYTKRNSFLAGLTVAQISEFSIIMVALGVSVGHISREILSLVTMVGLITIAGSTYLIMYSNKIYPLISKYLNIFEKKNVKEKKEIKEKYDVILFGYNRIGFGILKSLKESKTKYLVVDYNPEIVSNLKKFRVPVLYGDVYDKEFLDSLPLKNVKIVVSTIPDVETSTVLIKTVKGINPQVIVIVRANQIDDALKLYKSGADYVLTPHFLGGEYVANMVKNFGDSSLNYKLEKERHLKMLHERKNLGQEHPDVDKN
ncbi:MAG: cation:proton antiporter [Nanoarchaeota archaeon]